jgi:hypothetical protein
MEWATATRARSRNSEDPSDLELLEERWRVAGRSGRVVTCAIDRPTGPDAEVRAGYTVDHFHCTRPVAHVPDARVLADTWRGALLSLGYIELAV